MANGGVQKGKVQIAAEKWGEQESQRRGWNKKGGGKSSWNSNAIPTRRWKRINASNEKKKT